MSKFTKTRFLIPSLVLSVAVAMTVPAQAHNRYDPLASGTFSSLQITFGSTPRWRAIPGTTVWEIRGDQRPDYDMFRCGRNYYVYDNNRWYRSRRDRGEFMWIEDRYLPSQFTRVPREHWRNYPTAWTDEGRDSRYGRGDRGNGRGHGKHDRKHNSKHNGEHNGNHNGNGDRH